MQLKALPSFIYSLLFLSFSQALDGDMYDFFLPNGLKVILMEKHVSPKIGLGVYYNVGSQDELPGQKGINKIALRAILDGTDKYPYEKLNSKRDEFEMGYGDRSGRDITYMYSQLPIDQLEFALDFESDRMVNIILTDNKLVRIKEEYKVQYEKYYTNDEEVAINNSLAAILPDNHPYKIDEWGIWEQIDTLSISTCKNFLSQYYAPNNAVLVIVGDIIPEDATKLIYKYFAGIEPTKYISPEPDFAFEKNIKNNVPAFLGENEKKDFYEHFVIVSFFMPSSRNDDAILMEHLENILLLDNNQNGVLEEKYTNNDRLFTKLSVNAQTALGPSYFSMSCFTHDGTGSINKIKKSILNFFEFVGENGIGINLLKQYKKIERLKAYTQDNDYSSIATRLGTAELINGDYHFYNREFHLLEKLTNEDVKRVAKTYLHENNIYVFEITINKDNYSFRRDIMFNQLATRIWNPYK